MAKKKNPLDHHLENPNGIYYFRGGGYKFSLKTTKVKKAREMRDELCRQIVLYGRILRSTFENVPTYEEFADRFIKHLKRRNYRPMSIYGYECALQRSILPALKGMKIDEIRPRHINKWIDSMTCGNVTINTRLTKLKCMFDFAVEEEFIEKNPLEGFKKLKKDSKPINPLTLKEVNLFLENVNSHWKNWFTTAFFTGMRPEEMVGLKVKYLDFKKEEIQVRECVDHLGNEHPPKTESGVRDIPMFPMVKSALLKQVQGKEPDDYVFHSKNGCRVNAGNLNMRHWQKTLDKIRLDRRMMYTTRHTFATLMINSRETLGTVAKWMGHSSIQEIVGTYYRFIDVDIDGEGASFMRMYREKVGDQKEDKVKNVVQFLSKPNSDDSQASELSNENK